MTALATASPKGDSQPDPHGWSSHPRSSPESTDSHGLGSRLYSPHGLPHVRPSFEELPVSMRPASPDPFSLRATDHTRPSSDWVTPTSPPVQTRPFSASPCSHLASTPNCPSSPTHLSPASPAVQMPPHCSSPAQRRPFSASPNKTHGWRGLDARPVRSKKTLDRSLSHSQLVVTPTLTRWVSARPAVGFVTTADVRSS